MLILNYIFFFFLIILTFLSISGYGAVFNNHKNINIFEKLFLGFIFLAFFNTFFHFFFKLNFYVNLLILLLGIIFFKINKINIDKKKLFYFLIIIFLIPIFITQKYHEDFGYYHLPYALSFLEEKIIFGLANSNIAYTYNSIWLNVYPSFFTETKNYDFLTLPTFILFICFILLLTHNFLNSKDWRLSNLFSIVLIFYYLLKFTRISEFGVDLPSSLYSNLAIFYFIKFFETQDLDNKKNYFFLNTNFAVFSILIKLSAFPIILLTILLYLKNFKIFKKEYFQVKYMLIFFVTLVYYIQQFIYTGCFFFPTNLSCLDVDWFSQDFLEIKGILEYINKSYAEAKNTMTSTVYLQSFNWFPYWLKRNYLEILEHISTMLIPFFIIFFMIKKKETSYYSFNYVSFCLTTFVICGLIFWLSFSPVYRFAVPFFLTISLLIILPFFSNKPITKKIFMIFLIISICFSFLKNLDRILKKDQIFFGIQKIKNFYIFDKENSNSTLDIYYVDIEKNMKNGWQGRLCWDIPFVCSNKKIKSNNINGYLFLSENN